MTSATSGHGKGPARAVREVVDPLVDAAGLHLEDVVVTPAGRRTVVRVVVDLPEDAVGSLGSDRLGEVSREVSTALDVADPVRGEYVLEVTTPGTSRPLTQLRHFRRARTRMVRLVLKDGSTCTGRLVTAEADAYVLLTDAGERTVDPTDVARGEIELDFRGTDEDEEA
jgi:ribosome maturation factor RimP